MTDNIAALPLQYLNRRGAHRALNAWLHEHTDRHALHPRSAVKAITKATPGTTVTIDTPRQTTVDVLVHGEYLTIANIQT